MSSIRVRNLRKNYGPIEALKGISFDAEPGTILGFLGPNGAGKTTTMKILTCGIAADSGEAQVAGYDCLTESLSVRKSIGYLPENNPLYTDMTALEYLEFRAQLHQIPADKFPARLKKVLEECGLTEKAYLPIGTLSKGYKQRVGLAAAILHDPKILILDEPTAGLDPTQIQEIRLLIKKLGREKTILLSSHVLSEVEATCNQLVIIHAGQIVASGTPAELRGLVENHANLRVIIRGDSAKAETLLQEIPGVEVVTPFAVRERNATGFDLTTVKKKDLRSEISSQVMKAELELLEIYKEPVSLEEVFNQVTH